MKRRSSALAVLALVGGTAALFSTGSASAQYTPWLYWTLLPKAQMDLIVGEASGETALATIQDIATYMRDRQPEEWAGTLWESEAMMIRLKRYGFTERRADQVSRRARPGTRSRARSGRSSPACARSRPSRTTSPCSPPAAPTPT